LLFVPAELCEMSGGYLVWCHVRKDRPLAWALAGAAFLALNPSGP
jgi:drug/metabolite transporter superfamily protein YnfA